MRAGDCPFSLVTVPLENSSSPTQVMASVDTGAEVMLLPGNLPHHKGDVIHVEGLGRQNALALVIDKKAEDY